MKVHIQRGAVVLVAESLAEQVALDSILGVEPVLIGSTGHIDYEIRQHGGVSSGNEVSIHLMSVIEAEATS